MDERELERMLCAASDEPPSASFTVDEITHASRRITRRRRTALASVAGAVVVLAGGGVVVGSVLDSARTAATDSRSSVLSEPERTGAGGSGTAEPDPGTAGSGPSDGRGPAVRRLPDAPPSSAAGCAPVDPEVATALADGLGVARGAEPVASPVPGVDCSSGVRSAAYRVGDAIVSAVLVPPDEGVRLPTRSAGADVAEHRSGDGTVVVVVRTPTGHGRDRGAGDGRRLDPVAETVAEAVTS